MSNGASEVHLDFWTSTNKFSLPTALDRKTIPDRQKSETVIDVDGQFDLGTPVWGLTEQHDHQSNAVSSKSRPNDHMHHSAKPETAKPETGMVWSHLSPSNQSAFPLLEMLQQDTSTTVWQDTIASRLKNLETVVSRIDSKISKSLGKTATGADSFLPHLDSLKVDSSTERLEKVVARMECDPWLAHAGEATRLNQKEPTQASQAICTDSTLLGMMPQESKPQVQEPAAELSPKTMLKNVCSMKSLAQGDDDHGHIDKPEVQQRASTSPRSSDAHNLQFERMQEILKRFSNDLTDLRVQIRQLLEAAKTAELTFTSAATGDRVHQPDTVNDAARLLQAKSKTTTITEERAGLRSTGFEGHFATLSTAVDVAGIYGTKSQKLQGDLSRVQMPQDFGDAQALMTVLNQYDLQHLIARQNLCLPDEPHRTSALAELLASQAMERLVSIMICLNVLFLAYSADYAVKHVDQQMTPFIYVCEILFLVFYLFEMFVRLKVHGVYFFFNEEMNWNLFDFFLVGISIWDVFATHWTSAAEDEKSSGEGFNISFLRALRLFRMSKIFRILRVMRYFSELRMMLNCITMSIRPLFWCMLNMSIFFSIFAITFLHGVAGYLQDPSADLIQREKLIKDWGSIGRAILSLYKVTTGGTDWGHLADSLRVTGDIYFCLFLLFTAFVLLAVLNIMTGIFVDRAMRIASEDRDGMILEKLYHERKMVEDLTRTFCIITETSHVNVEEVPMTKDQFMHQMNLPAMRTYFAVMGLEIWDPSRFFALLTNMSPNGKVDAQVFVRGCMQLRSDPKGIAVQGILADIQGLAEEVRGMRDVLNLVDVKVTQKTRR
jgi:hypothetical protein